MLAHFAEAQALAAILARRQVVGMLTAAQNRLGTATAPVPERIAAHIAWLEQGLADMDGELACAIAADPAWRERDALLRSVPGVGPVLSKTRLAELPELGALSRHEVVALADVAPLAATRHNPAIAVFYQRLCAAGKTKKSALVACMRKLPTVLNALLHHRTPGAHRRPPPLDTRHSCARTTPERRVAPRAPSAWGRSVVCLPERRRAGAVRTKVSRPYGSSVSGAPSLR